MGVGLNLIGNLPKPEQLENWFNQVWSWTTENFPGMAAAGLGQAPSEDHQKVDLRFHPAADPVKLWLQEPSILRVSADTSSAGPGYHLFLCDYLYALGQQFGITWHSEEADEATRSRKNPTFFSKNPEQTNYEMLNWLATMVATANIMAETGSFLLSMSPTHQFSWDAPILTPMGPRSREWLLEVSKNPAAGVDVFPWFKQTINAEFFRNRALVHMWSDIRWRAPLADGDASMMRNVLGLLAQAYKKDPTLDYPWHEWAEIFGYLKIDDELSGIVNEKAAATPQKAAIGYRRHGNVRVTLDQGWSVEVPSSFSETGTYDPNTRNHTWELWNDGLLIWFTTYPTYGDNTGKIVAVEEAALELDELQASLGQLIEEDKVGKIWRQTYKSGDPKKSTTWRFSSIFLVPGRLALAHIYSEKSSDQDRALQFFHSVKNSAGTSVKYIEQPRFPRLDLVCAT